MKEALITTVLVFGLIGSTFCLDTHAQGQAVVCENSSTGDRAVFYGSCPVGWFWVG